MKSSSADKVTLIHVLCILLAIGIVIYIFKQDEITAYLHKTIQFIKDTFNIE